MLMAGFDADVRMTHNNQTVDMVQMSINGGTDNHICYVHTAEYIHNVDGT